MDPSAPGRGTLRTLLDIGALDPLTTAAALGTAAWWGTSLAAPFDAAALRHPWRTALVDDHGALSYLELRRRTDAVAAALRARGVGPDSRVGVACTNHRGVVEGLVGAAKTGATTVAVGPSLGPGVLADVCARESLDLLLHDAGLLHTGSGDTPPGDAGRSPAATDLIEVAPERDATWSLVGVDRPRFALLAPTVLHPAATVVMTSGTTGAPRGALRRTRPGGLDAALGLLGRLPYRRGDTVVLAAPAYHAWGLSQLAVGAALAATVVLRRRFDAATALDDVVTHRADALVVVPTMLHRMLAATRPDHDLSGLRMVASSGGPLPGELARRWMDVHGDTLHNVYGSTEAGLGTIAAPADLRAHPTTAGRPLPGTEVDIVDDRGRRLPTGATGRVLLGGSGHFDGYTDGTDRDRLDGRLDTGDIGHVDAEGLVFVTGRSDDMIVTGGENVVPSEIENVLLAHPGVAEVAVVGVPDDDLGTRIEAFVVRAPGRRPRAATLVELVAGELARFKAPRTVHFVDELPISATGKILRRTLAATAAGEPSGRTHAGLTRLEP